MLIKARAARGAHARFAAALWCMLLCMMLPASPALAHTTGTGLAAISLQDDQVLYRLSVVPDQLAEPATQVLTGALAQEQPSLNKLTDWLREHLRLKAAGEPCATTSVAVTAQADARAVVELRLRCPKLRGRLELSDSLNQVFGDHYRSIVSLQHSDGRREERVLQEKTRAAQFELGGDDGPRYWLDFIELGARHIVSGADHLLFLAALLLGARALWPALGVVTAFTIAHSVTLALAVLGLVNVPPIIVEPLIAASIIWVGVQNWLARPGGRWPISFVFGLVHGLGFAGGLIELQLPRESLLRALIGFNVGVELAQIVVVVLGAPLFLLIWRRPAQSIPNKLLALVLIGLGAYWLVQRLLG